MIRDIIIIKDGMPLLSKNFSPDSQDIFSKSDTLIMMSGFFSAINSFSDQFENLGTISELKLSNKDDIRLSFLRDNSLPNLFYLATFDDSSKSVNVQRALRKVSRRFLQKYNAERILGWRGRKDTFKAFEQQMAQFVEEETEESEVLFKDKVLNLFNSVKDKLKDENPVDSECKENSIPEWHNYKPLHKSKEIINLRFYLTGETSCNIYNQIDGENTIINIADNLKITPKVVFNSCKNLVKMGFISL